MYELDKAAFGHFLAQLRGTAAQRKGDDPEGACRDAVRVRQSRQQVGTGRIPHLKILVMY